MDCTGWYRIESARSIHTAVNSAHFLFPSHPVPYLPCVLILHISHRISIPSHPIPFHFHSVPFHSVPFHSVPAKTELNENTQPSSSSLCLFFCVCDFRSDVYIPTKKYAAVVSNMNDAKRRADSKLLEAQKGDLVLSKAERARYVSDKKT